MSTVAAGQRVRVGATKWPARPHWEFDAELLGDDEHGTWLGAPVGTLLSRPGVSLVTDQPQVTLVPHEGPFMATFYAPGGLAHCDVYVDISTVPTRAPASAGGKYSRTMIA